MEKGRLIFLRVSVKGPGIWPSMFLITVHLLYLLTLIPLHIFCKQNAITYLEEFLNTLYSVIIEYCIQNESKLYLASCFVSTSDHYVLIVFAHLYLCAFFVNKIPLLTLENF